VATSKPSEVHREIPKSIENSNIQKSSGDIVNPYQKSRNPMNFEIMKCHNRFVRLLGADAMLLA